MLDSFLVLLVLRLSSPVPSLGLLLIPPGLVSQGILREQGLDLDEDRGDGHALRPALALPSTKDAQANLTPRIEVGMSAK